MDEGPEQDSPEPAAAEGRQEYGPAPFLEQDCAITLREAIAAHRARVRGLITAEVDPTVGPLFDGHDACHAVFGCSTSPADEARVDSWTLFATTMTLRRYSAYLSHPAVAPILREFARWDMIGPALAATADVPRIWARARAMTRVWDFDGWADRADMPVRDIRRAYGIRVLSAM